MYHRKKDIAMFVFSNIMQPYHQASEQVCVEKSCFSFLLYFVTQLIVMGSAAFV